MAADYRERGVVLPERAVHLPDLTIGGKTPKELEEMLDASRVRVSDFARDMLKSPSFTTLPDQKTLSLVRARVSDMDLTYPGFYQILHRAHELGWDKCLPEVAVYLRLALKNQRLKEELFVCMNPIAGRGGRPSVFVLERDEHGLRLHGAWAEPVVGPDRWGSGNMFVFSLRPPKLAPVEAGK